MDFILRTIECLFGYVAMTLNNSQAMGFKNIDKEINTNPDKRSAYI